MEALFLAFWHERPPRLRIRMSHVFDRSGLAALSELETREWRELFSLLEKEQSEFLAKEGEFRSREYKWPRDPLHTWSRVWEYPYTYHHLQQARTQWPADPPPRVVDLGSGVTYFPFSLARLGYHVTCMDIDPVCAIDIARAARLLPLAPGKVDFRLINGDILPLEDKEADAVYCISVLEHIPSPEKTIKEIARILKPGGHFVLTIDLDLRGDSEIGIGAYKRLLDEIKANFEYHFADATIHPADMLDNTKGAFRTCSPSGIRRAWFSLKQRIKPCFGKDPSPLLPFVLAVHGFALTRKM